MITSAISKHTRQPPAQFHVCCKDRNLSRTDTNVRNLVFCLFLQAVHISCQRSTLVISTGLESTSSLSNPKEAMGSASKCQKTPISQRDNGQMLQACFWSRDIATQIKSDWPQCWCRWGFSAFGAIACEDKRKGSVCGLGGSDQPTLSLHLLSFPAHCTDPHFLPLSFSKLSFPFPISWVFLITAFLKIPIKIPL